MDKTETQLTQNQIEALILAANEKQITKQDIIADLLPLFKEYFLANVSAEDETLTIDFLNGQKFKLKLEEIK